jgi:hypothetical protein
MESSQMSANCWLRYWKTHSSGHRRWQNWGSRLVTNELRDICKWFLEVTSVNPPPLPPPWHPVTCFSTSSTSSTWLSVSPMLTRLQSAWKVQRPVCARKSSNCLSWRCSAISLVRGTKVVSARLACGDRVPTSLQNSFLMGGGEASLLQLG